MASGGDDKQPRKPHDLMGLFKFAMEATKSEDAPHPSVYLEMDPEKRKFLEEALKSIQVDVFAEIEKAVKKLLDTESSVEDKLNAIEIVRDFAENIDIANDFCKVGGLCVVVPNLNAPQDSVRANTCSLVGEIAQNNPFGQQQLLDLNILPKLIELLSDDALRVGQSAMHAISCMVRHFEPCLARFIEHGGLECVLGCLESNDEKLNIKTAFLLSTLCSEFSTVRDSFIELNAVERVIQAIQPLSDYDVKLETQLSALSILTDCPAGVARCHGSDESVMLRSKLEEVIKLCTGKSECQEQIEYCQSLLKKCLTKEKESTDR